MKTVLFIFSIALLASCSMMKNDKMTQVNIKNGIIEGEYDNEDQIIRYLGVPFAKPPVGGLRWKAPQPMGNWEDVLETKSFGARPVQTNIWGDMVYRSDTMSEDCLYLNVWKPADKSEDPLPVLVYFYGGGFVAGEASEPRYDGASMAKKGIIAITVNYRLNIFGSFAHPALSAESPYKASGNYGLLDQNAALKWVKENIAAFGGNPNKITIAGESAGSMSVSLHMASPLSKDLIAGAIGESGASINPSGTPVSLAEAEREGLIFCDNSGFETIEELRALSTMELFKVYQLSKRYGFSEVIDGYFLPKTLPEIFSAKEQAQIPLLAGWTSAELPGQVFMKGRPYVPFDFITQVEREFPNHKEQVLEHYPHATTQEVELSATDLASDQFIVYASWKWTDLHSKNSQQPVYRYLFHKVAPAVKGNMNPLPFGAPHASDIQYCMGNLDLIDNIKWTADDYKVSETALNYFANFIKTGNPNGSDLPEWTSIKAEESNPKVMNINVESKLLPAKNDARFRFLDEYYKD